MPQHDNEEWLTRKEVADLIKYSTKTLANWGSQGIGPRFEKVEGGHPRYRVSDVVDWQNNQFSSTQLVVNHGKRLDQQ
ncbi:helix-turn-helix transcriptional regulator [Nocardia brasiliensis]|uniref:helix-turn-helix transcriptional regulator n=1 Tax=Nocardia brasiliensis TaxID=37326 RepID=UPI00313A97DE